MLQAALHKVETGSAFRNDCCNAATPPTGTAQCNIQLALCRNISVEQPIKTRYLKIFPSLYDRLNVIHKMAASREDSIAECRITDSVEKMILALNDCPSFWDTSLAIYKEKQEKTKDTQALASPFRVLVDELKKLLHSLRTCITKEIK